MKLVYFTTPFLLGMLIIGGCKSVSLQDDGTNTFKSNTSVPRPSIYDDGTNSAINQLIMSNLPKNSATPTKSSTAKNNPKSTTTPTKSKSTKSVSGSATAVKTASTPPTTYVPPKVVVPTSSTVQFYYPIANPGNMAVKNGGIDFTVPTTTPVYPSASGVVIFAGNKDSFGNAVFVYNDNNYITIYYNLSSITVAKGDYVSDFSKPIGTASGTFHFEIRQKTDSGITVMDASKMLLSRTQIPKK